MTCDVVLLKTQTLLPSYVWVDDLAREQYVFCVAIYDGKHKWSIELQHGPMLKGHECDANACGTCSSGSDLVNIQSSLVHNLWR